MALDYQKPAGTNDEPRCICCDALWATGAVVGYACQCPDVAQCEACEKCQPHCQCAVAKHNEEFFPPRVTKSRFKRAKE